MRTHYDSNQPHARVQPKRRIRSRLENILNLTRPGIVSFALVFCMLLTLFPASTVHAMAAEAGEVSINSWNDLEKGVFSEGKDGDGITNIVIPQGVTIRAARPIEVNKGLYIIRGEGVIYADFLMNKGGQLDIKGVTLKPVDSEHPYVLEINKSGANVGIYSNPDSGTPAYIEGKIRNNANLSIIDCVLHDSKEFGVPAEVINETGGILYLNGSGSSRIYGTVTNHGSWTYTAGAVRKIVNDGNLSIEGATVGDMDLSDCSVLDDGFYTTIENIGEGEITIQDSSIYNCHIDNMGKDRLNESRLEISDSKAIPSGGEGFSITNQGILGINSGVFHDIEIENNNFLTIAGGTFYHAEITSTDGSVAIISGTFQGEQDQLNSGSRIRCEGGSIGFGSDDGEAPKFINNECLDATPIYILGMASRHLCRPELLKETHREQMAEFLKIMAS